LGAVEGATGAIVEQRELKMVTLEALEVVVVAKMGAQRVVQRQALAAVLGTRVGAPLTHLAHLRLVEVEVARVVRVQLQRLIEEATVETEAVIRTRAQPFLMLEVVVEVP
jgi:hypothetical protein